MEVVRYAAAESYQAPKHFDVSCFRLQGMGASTTQSSWVGLSHFLPGGGAEMDATPSEKIYVVLSGQITVETPESKVTLGPRDSCVIPANESRSVINQTNDVTTMLVIIENPAK